MSNRLWLACALLLSTSLPACTADDTKERLGACPAPGRAQAGAITGAEVLLAGPNAVGGEGDYFLRSDKATFVVSGIDRGITYYHYGGILVDAVPTERCEQVADEQFEELGLLFGKLNLTENHKSTLRAFRGESVEVVNDGADGKAAHVRVTGVDDYYWLVEYELIKRAFEAGDPRTLSQPFGVKVVVDYKLDPGAAVLQIDFTIENQTSQTQRFLAGPEMIVGDLLETVRYGKTPLEFGGFSLLGDIPFITFGSAAGSYAYAMRDARMSQAHISGVNATLDLQQALNKPIETPAGGSATVTMFFAAGPRDHHSAARLLQPYVETPVPGWTFALRPFSGQVVEKSGEPVSGATVDVQMPAEGDWLTLERYVTGEDGRFGDELAFFEGANLGYRVIVSQEGRLPTEPVAFDAPPAEPLAIKAQPRGELAYRVVDSAGTLIPAKITLYQGGERKARFFVMGEGTAPVPPGDYEISVTRGWEYGTHQGLVTVPEGKPGKLDVELVHWVDTSGYLSADTHVHSAPSPDSQVPIPMRIRTAAAEGVEVPVATDHEIIHGIASGIAETGLEKWVNTVSGEEFTATIPEHVTIFPVHPDESLRGGPPTWYMHGVDELFAEAYGRGAKVGFLNHPRLGCSYLCLIGYDPETAMPAMQTPEPLGLPVTSSVWTWNFQGIEYMNGTRDPFIRAGEEDRTGLFDDWQSFLNHGHRIVAVGASDEHGYDDLGMPRIFFGAKSDKPELFQEQDLVDAVYDGNILVSTGAFARVSVAGKTMGDVVTVAGGNVSLNIKIEAVPEIDVSHFRVYVNCDQYGPAVTTTAPHDVVKYDAAFPLTVTSDANITVIGFGKNYLPRGLPQFNPRNVPRFTTNAIYVDVNGDGDFDAPGDKSCTYTRD